MSLWTQRQHYHDNLASRLIYSGGSQFGSQFGSRQDAPGTLFLLFVTLMKSLNLFPSACCVWTVEMPLGSKM